MPDFIFAYSTQTSNLTLICPQSITYLDYFNADIQRSVSMETVNDFRVIMRRWVSGVVIVTSTFEGHSHGMTVDSFTSVSMVPPMVTFTLANQTRTRALVEKSGWVGVTLLGASQQDLAERFSGKFAGEDRFAGLQTFTLQRGIPLFSGGMGALEGRVVHAHEMATSTLYIAEVLSMVKAEDVEPLVFFNRGYHRIIYE
jgi:flavin reductase (DIM6/NTAB) family NADH-FMN oxidoreductase RutF